MLIAFLKCSSEDKKKTTERCDGGERDRGHGDRREEQTKKKKNGRKIRLKVLEHGTCGAFFRFEHPH